VPLLAFTVGYLGKKIKKYSKRIQSQLSVMFNAVEEVLNSIKIVKAFRREEHEHKEFEKINKRHLKLWQKSQIYAAMSVPFSELNSVLTGVVVVILGGKMILDPASNFSLGDFTAFLFAVFSMLHPLKVLSQLYADIKKAGVSLDRIALVLNDESDIKDHPDMVSKDSFDNQISFGECGLLLQGGNRGDQKSQPHDKKGRKGGVRGCERRRQDNRHQSREPHV